jgi:hypothetical protein
MRRHAGRSQRNREPMEVVVVGGGVAGLEPLVALRGLAGERRYRARASRR